MQQAAIDSLLSFFKALADENRLKIIGLLAGRERSVRELAALLELKEPTVSHHLSVLREPGLVRLRVDGNTHWHRLNEQVLKGIPRSVFKAENLVKLADGVERGAWDQKVLANFLEGERLKKIPAGRKKRWAVLRWLAGRFETGMTYSEAELNRILKRHHRDCATLRRELIGYKMLQREKGFYRRLPQTQWHGP